VSTYIAFLRAVNVAGHASVRMSDVRDAFAAAGCRNVRTYIQSGNVIFESAERSPGAILQRVRTKLRDVMGDAPEIILRTAGELQELIRRAPFKGAEAETGIKLYVAFLSQRPRSRPDFPLVSDKEALEVVGMSGRDVFVVSRRKANGLFGFPNLFIEQEFGGTATSRNWSTVTRIVSMCPKPQASTKIKGNP